jgi:hypothetical protein
MNNSNEMVFTGNTLVIPKSKFVNLKNSSKWLNAVIDTDVTNKNEIFDKNGNFILRKDRIYDIPYYDKETESMKSIKSDKVWKVLVDVLLEGHTTDYKTLKLVEDYYMFKNISQFNNPTLPESESVYVRKGEFYANKSKAQIKKERINNRLLGITRNFNNRERGYKLTSTQEALEERGYDFLSRNKLLKESENNNRRFKALTYKKELEKEEKANLEALANIGGINVNLIKKAIANRTKYSTSKNRLGKKTQSEREKEKKRTERRERARGRKTAKRGYNNNNNNNNY